MNTKNKSIKYISIDLKEYNCIQQAQIYNPNSILYILQAQIVYYNRALHSPL